MDKNLSGKKVLVIGGSSGIGYGIARSALESKAHVIIVSSQTEHVETALKRLRKPFGGVDANVTGFTADLAGPGMEHEIQALFDKVGKVDHVVYTAGDSLAIKPLAEWEYHDVVAAGDVRFFAPLFVAKHAAKVLPKSQHSSITFTNGSIAFKPLPDWAVVASFATALQGLTQNLALDLAPIRVNTVAPGAVDTALWDKEDDMERKDLMEDIAEVTLTGEVAKPTDVALAYLFCMACSYLTGQVIQVEGGRLLTFQAGPQDVEKEDLPGAS